MRRRHALLVAALALAVLARAPPVAGQGDEGLGLTPPRFDIPSAQPGESYVLTVQVQNQYDSTSTMTVETDGEAGAWATTDPGGGFSIAPRSQRAVEVTVDVPAGAGPGTRGGTVQFTTEPKGSGPTQVRSAVALVLNVTVGGEAVVRLEWTGARVEDAAEGDPVHAFVRVRNAGNVRATAEAAGQVLPFGGDGPALAGADGSAEVRPGEEAEVPVTFAAGLSAGQYRARLQGGDLEETLPFKVFAPGEAAPDGVLRGLFHGARGEAGQPMRIDARFANTGDVAVRSARFNGEVRRGGDLVATLQSEALVVAAGGEIDLASYWTPGRPGTYTIEGHVTYDGYLTEPVASQVAVSGDDEAWPWWWLLLLLALLALVALWRVWRRRGRQHVSETSRTGRR